MTQLKTKLSPKQIKAYSEADARINIYEGAVRSGKSFTCDLRFLHELKTGPDGDYLVCGKSEGSILRNVINPFNRLTGGLIRYKTGHRKFTLFGRDVYVVGANDMSSEQKIRGATFAGAYCDEITLIPDTFFKMLLSRLSIPGSKLFGTTNPDSPYHWLKKDFIERLAVDPEELKVFSFTIDDNPSLTKEYITSLKKSYQGLWYKRFIEGQWVLAEGSIFDFFDQTYHVKQNPPSYAKYYILGVDYGTSNAFAATLVGFNDDVHPSLWVEKEYYFDSKASGYQKTDGEYANDLDRTFGQYSPSIIYLDPSAESFQVELKKRGMRVKQADNSVLDGIRFVSSLFTGGDLCILSQCKNLIHEIEGYVWDEKAARFGEDKPVKVRDHAIDSMRYALYSHWGKKHSLKESTREESYQQSQQRQYAKNPMAYPGFTNSHGWQVMNGGF